MQAFPSAITQRNNILVRVMIMVLPAILLLATVVPTAIAKNEEVAPIVSYTYTITDGDQVVTHTTQATDPAEVLEQAGVVLKSGDTYAADAEKLEISISRIQDITVYYCGEKMLFTSYGETVQDLLERQNLSCDGDYVVSTELSSETYDGMEVMVDCVVLQSQTHTEEIPFETTYCYAPSMEKDQQMVTIKGKPGQLQITTEVLYVNSQETERNVVEEVVIAQPVNEVIVIGTGEKVGSKNEAPAIGDGVIVTPDGQVLTYSKTGQFKATAYTHTDEGCDMTTATGTTVHWGTVAVDPTVIPYGTRMFIVTNDGAYIYGLSTAEDCGGAIKGNRLDLYFPTDAECWQFGVRSATVYFLDE